MTATEWRHKIAVGKLAPPTDNANPQKTASAVTQNVADIARRAFRMIEI